MNTELITINDPDEDAAGVRRAAEILKSGGIVAIPTETVYGLAASAFDTDAIRRVFIAKGRPQDNPLIVHVSDAEMLSGLVKKIPEKARLCADRFWPGPFTMVLEKTERVPLTVTAGLQTVAVRMPSNAVAHAIIKTCGLPLAAPSANISGAPSTTSAKHVIDDLNGKVDAVVVSAPSLVGLESTVVTFCSESPTLLRPGAVTLEQLKAVLPEIKVADAVLNKLDPDVPVQSPGMKYKHYSPKIDVIMVRGTSARFVDYVNARDDGTVCALCFDEDIAGLAVPFESYGPENDRSVQANRLFEALRKLDDMGMKTAYAHAPETDGVGLAVFNRLLRACAFRVVEI